MSTICSNARTRETDVSTSIQLSEILQTFDSEVTRLPTDGLRIKCSNSGCNWQGTYFDKYHHLRKCPHSYINCKQCGVKIKRADLCAHLSDVCWKLKETELQVQYHLNKDHDYFPNQEIGEPEEVQFKETLHRLEEQEPEDVTKECLHQEKVTELEDHMMKESLQKSDEPVSQTVDFVQGQEMAVPNAHSKANYENEQQIYPKGTSSLSSQQKQPWAEPDDRLKTSYQKNGHHLKEKQRKKVYFSNTHHQCT